MSRLKPREGTICLHMKPTYNDCGYEAPGPETPGARLSRTSPIHPRTPAAAEAKRRPGPSGSGCRHLPPILPSKIVRTPPKAAGCGSNRDPAAPRPRTCGGGRCHASQPQARRDLQGHTCTCAARTRTCGGAGVRKCRCRHAARYLQPLKLDPQFIGLDPSQAQGRLWPRSCGCSTRCSCTRWHCSPARVSQAWTVRSSIPNAATTPALARRCKCRLERTSVRHAPRGHDQRNGLFRCPQPVEGRTRSCGKRLPAHPTAVALLVLAVAQRANIAFADLSACQTRPVRAREAYLVRVHRHLPFPRQKGLCR